jgi:hypothetical protein
MIENYQKCCQCKEHKKEEDILTYYENNTKFSICKNCFEKNLLSNHQTFLNNPVHTNSNLSKFGFASKNEDKKLDLNEPIKKNVESFLLNKKRRVTKKIIFKKKKTEKNFDKFEAIINKLIFISAEKNKLIMTSKLKKQFKNKTCDACGRKKLIKKKKMINFLTLNDFINFFDELYNTIEKEENKELLKKISQIKYNQILEQQKTYLNMKLKNKTLDLSFERRIICFFCIRQSLIKSNGINLLWEKLMPEIDKKEKKKTDAFPGFESILITNNKTNGNIFSESQIKADNNDTDKNNTLDEDINLILNDRNANIFDLILGDEEGEGDGEVNDIDNISDENKSIKNKINNNLNSGDFKKINETKKDKNKLKKGKINVKENKILFKKTIENDNKSNQISNINKLNNLNNININNSCLNNLNNINNNNYNVNDKNKNINIINMNNINNINQFNEPNFINKNNEPIQPLFYDINSTPSLPNQANSFYKSNLINNNSGISNIGYLNNGFVPNEESLYDRLNNQLGNLKNKLSLMSNLNNSRIANNINSNNDSQIFIMNNSLREYLSHFQNSMHIISNYMNNISDMLDKYSCINDNSLSLMNSMINGTISTQNLIQLKNNNNHFSQLLNYNYNIQKMNTELCDIINKHLNHS